MSRIIITRRALANIEAIQQFWQDQNAQEVRKEAVQCIRSGLVILRTSPRVGQVFSEDYSYREIVIDFGSTGYLVLYDIDPTTADLMILAIRHQRAEKYR